MAEDSASTLWRNARLATFAPRAQGIGVVLRGALVTAGGRIKFAGEEAEAPRVEKVVDCEGRWITPALIDCHTHLVYAGDRAQEFEMRLEGASYAEIARAGGGIVSTVSATRAASEDELIKQSLPRLDALIAEGIGAVEIKSGYGLDLPSERKMLRAARRLADEREVTVSTTFLGAHALPPEFLHDRAGYLDLVVEDMLPKLAAEGLVDAVDGFLETIAFNADEITRVFEAARRLGLPVKLHAEQLSNQGGAALAARYGALSADHLEHLDEAGAAALARANTVAVLLPGAYYTLRETQAPPIDLIAQARRGDGRRHRLQSRHFADDLYIARAQHGGDAVSPDGRGVSDRRHPQRGASVEAGGRARLARSGQACRFRHLGHRAARRARLSPRLQSAASTRVEGTMKVRLRAGAVPLKDWREVWRGAEIELDPSGAGRIKASAEAVQRILARGAPVYGVNTGFGKLASVRIDEADLAQLQRNIVLSHAVGVGETTPIETTFG